MTILKSLEDKTNNPSCSGCIIYPILAVPLFLSVWTCGYIFGKYSNEPELPNKEVINNEEPKKPYPEKAEEQTK